MANAAADYCMERLQHGNEPFDFHMKLAEIPEERRQRDIRFAPDNLRRLTKIMMDYAGAAIPAASAENSLELSDRLPFSDLAQARLDEADILIDVSREIKSAVLTYEGRQNDIEMSEFVQGETR